MRKRKYYAIVQAAIFMFAACFSLKAEEEEGNKFKVTPSGRVLVDGGVFFSPEKNLFKDGMAIPEARLGAKFQYGNWSSWIDVGFAYGKIGLRNMWVQYDFNEHNSLRIGNFLQPFGLQSNVSASLKSTYEQPLVSALFTPGLQLGAMYTFQNPSFYSSSSFHVESSALTNVMNYPEFNKQGFTVLSRFAWRKKDSGADGKSIVQAGLSLGVSTPQRKLDENGFDVHDGFTNSANFPTKISNVTALSATTGDASVLFKFTPELLFAKNRFAVESQYFFQAISRKNNLPTYIAQGGYVTLRGLITHGKYSYDPAAAQLVYPKKNTVEWVVDYNYATLSDPNAGIYGGRANSFNITFNYYINPYITARLNYAYTHTWGRIDVHPITQNVIQARIMVLF